MPNILQQLSAEMVGVVNGVRHSLVQITHGPMGAGAGILWQADGLIITNAHVVRRKSLTVTLPDGRILPAKILARDPERDIAALRVDADHLPAAAIGDSRQLRPGQWVFAVGHPWGVAGAATAGVVIGQGHDLPEMHDRRREWLMVSLRLRPGNSGGPLVDSAGRVVGINTIMTGPEVGGAVPVQAVKEFLKKAASA
jgi:serine protease Do